MDFGIYCDRHPRYLAVQIVDCGRYHLLCFSCVKVMSQNGDNLCPICHKKTQEATDGMAHIEKISESSKLVHSIFNVKFQIFQTKLDTKKPLPLEMNLEIIACMDPMKIYKMLPTSKAIGCRFGKGLHKYLDGKSKMVFPKNSNFF